MRRGTRFMVPTMVGLFVVVAATPLGTPQPAAAASSDLFFSEYVEGSSNNKALEIYNGTGAPVDLAAADYNVQIYFNGSTSAGLTINLSGASLANGDVYVLAHSSAHADIRAQADQTNGAGWFNGDDAVVLRRGSTVVDSIGQIGVDPGSQWGSGLASTADNTLRRKASVEDGDTDPSDLFDPSVEWDGFALDTFDGLGSHGGDAPPAVSSTTPADSATNVASDADISVTFSEPVNVSGSWFTIACANSGAHTATVTGGPTTFTLDPDADFARLEECTVTVHAAQVADQDAFDPPDNMAASHVFSFTTEGNVCTLPYTRIYAIQGSGMSAAITGPVTTQGVVVGDFEGATSVGLRGVYLQDAAGDGNGNTSDGIFVFTGNADNGLAVGDVVRVDGNAGDFSGQTQVSASSVTLCGPADEPVAPVDVTLPVAAIADFEKYEGMLVRFPQELVISEYFNYDRFGELVLALPLAGEDRPFTPTSIEEPGSAEYFARLDANRHSRITLDDGLGSQNPMVTRHPNGQPFSLTNRFRGGDIVANTVGVLGFGFDLYRIQPTAPADYTAANPRPGAPATVGGNLQVASFNTLNFFPTIDSGPDVCGPQQNMDCRGADNADEFERQRNKLVAALVGLDAEVVGLNELENTTGVDPLGGPEGLVTALNQVLGAGTYDYIDTGVIGTDAIRVGLIYKPSAVTPVGGFEILESSDDPRFNDDKSRPVLAQTFRENSSSGVFTAAVNHLKSKGSSCNDVGDPDVGDGQGNCNVTRTLAAQALVDWLATDPTDSGDPDYLIIGDLNAYAQEDPIDAVRAGADGIYGTGDDYTNLVALYGGTHAYSYVFDGMAGYLDHALSNSSMTAQVTGATEWHINADEPDLIDYDTSFKSDAQDALYEPNAYRSSDHDPVLVGLALTPDVGRVTGSGTWAGGSFDISVQFNPSGDAPTGATQLWVDDGTLVSTGYDWLSVNGTRAIFQGTGALDGTPGYGFLVSVSDGGSPGRNDRIRVRIWDADGDTVYDSQPGGAVNAAPTSPLTSGNLVVHKVR